MLDAVVERLEKIVTAISSYRDHSWMLRSSQHMTRLRFVVALGQGADAGWPMHRHIWGNSGGIVSSLLTADPAESTIYGPFSEAGATPRRRVAWACTCQPSPMPIEASPKGGSLPSSAESSGGGVAAPAAVPQL